MSIKRKVDGAMLESLTEEQNALMNAVAAEYVADVGVYRPFDKTVIGEWLTIAYGLYDLAVPSRVEYVGSPEAACKLASELTGEAVTWTDDCGFGDGGWLAFYDYFRRIGVLTEDESADFMSLVAFRRHAWDSILLDDCAIVVGLPIALRVDDAGNLHAAGRPCLEWADGAKDYAWHGEWMPERVIMGAAEFSREEYIGLTNTEQRRAVGEIAGWARVADLLGARIVDSWTDAMTGLGYSLLRCEDGTQLLRKTSPKLKSGNQPIYHEPVHEDLACAEAARKWQATGLDAAACNSDPRLTYGTES